MQSLALERAMPWLASLALLVVWETGCALFNVPEFVLPKPTVIAAALVQYAGPIWFHASHTLVTTVLGFALSVVAGVLLGIAVGASRLTYRDFYPMLVGFNSIPKVAIVPVRAARALLSGEDLQPARARRGLSLPRRLPAAAQRIAVALSRPRGVFREGIHPFVPAKAGT